MGVYRVIGRLCSDHGRGAAGNPVKGEIALFQGKPACGEGWEIVSFAGAQAAQLFGGRTGQEYGRVIAVSKLGRQRLAAVNDGSRRGRQLDRSQKPSGMAVASAVRNRLSRARRQQRFPQEPGKIHIPAGDAGPIGGAFREGEIKIVHMQQPAVPVLLQVFCKR